MQFAFFAPQGHALGRLGAAHRVVEDLVGDLQGQLASVAPLDFVQHHVEPGDAAAAGHALAVDHVELLLGDGVGVLLREGLQARPLDRRLVAGEELGAGQDEGADVHGAQYHAAAVHPPQPGEQLGVVIVLAVPAAADENGVPTVVALSERFALEGHAVAGGHDAAVDRQEAPPVERAAAQVIGDPERLQGRRQRRHVEARDEHHREGLGRVLCLTLHRGISCLLAACPVRRVRAGPRSVHATGRKKRLPGEKIITGFSFAPNTVDRRAVVFTIRADSVSSRGNRRRRPHEEEVRET